MPTIPQLVRIVSSSSLHTCRSLIKHIVRSDINLYELILFFPVTSCPDLLQHGHHPAWVQDFAYRRTRALQLRKKLTSKSKIFRCKASAAISPISAPCKPAALLQKAANQHAEAEQRLLDEAAKKGLEGLPAGAAGLPAYKLIKN